MNGPTSLFSDKYSENWNQLLRHGDTGHQVAAWQLVLKKSDDKYRLDESGIFGDLTHNATLSWQVSRQLEADGIVGPLTRAKIGVKSSINRKIKHIYSIIKDIKYIEAKNWTRHYRRNVVDLVVIHCMEGSESSTRAERCANWMANRNPRFPAPKASPHYCVDNNSIVQCVPEHRIAWHAKGANKIGIGIEHAGFSRQTIDEWLDVFGHSMLEISSILVSNICKKWDIPIEFVDAENLLLGERGITTHAEITKAFKKSTHTDPGKGFPIDIYIRMVNDYAYKSR